MKNAILLLCAGFIFSFLIYAGPVSSARSDEKKGGKGTVNVANLIETTERSYLFVYPSEDRDKLQTGSKRRISVTTLCQKPDGAGPEDRKCVHEIEIQPGNARFKLNAGEDVVMIDLPGEDDLLMLGTVEYGYENIPDVIRLYNEKGKYLGKVKGINLVTRPDQAEIIAQPFNLKTAIENDGKYYVILVKEGNEKEYETLVLKKGAEPQRVPFSIAIPDKEKCAVWYIEEFTKNGEGLADLIIKLKGVSCSSREGTLEKYLKCSMAK